MKNALALFNFGWRLDREVVTDWDEAIYANTAWEMFQSGDLIGTTYFGVLDYYNTKPPLNVWLIVTAFHLFGPGLFALRVTSFLSAALSVVALVWWLRRTLGPEVAVLAGAILATTFGFIHVHAGRSANTDALFTLLVMLTAVVAWAAARRVAWLVLLGPLMAAVFMLRGMAVLMPMAIALMILAARYRHAAALPWRPLAAAAAMFVLPVGAWCVARWRIDGGKFLSKLVEYDFVARVVRPIEEHSGSAGYYVDLLWRQEPQFVLLVMATLIAGSVRWARLKAVWRLDRGRSSVLPVLSVWAFVTVAMPTVMQTKVPWYMNTFYPVLAAFVAGTFVTAQRGKRARVASAMRRRLAFGLVVLAIVGSEARIVWYSLGRDLANSSQGLLLGQRDAIAGNRVFGHDWSHSEMFLMRALVNAEYVEVADAADLERLTATGDFLLTRKTLTDPTVRLHGSTAGWRLYQRVN